jgi:hypothetical protein
MLLGSIDGLGDVTTPYGHISDKLIREIIPI